MHLSGTCFNPTVLFSSTLHNYSFVCRIHGIKKKLSRPRTYFTCCGQDQTGKGKRKQGWEMGTSQLVRAQCASVQHSTISVITSHSMKDEPVVTGFSLSLAFQCRWFEYMSRVYFHGELKNVGKSCKKNIRVLAVEHLS